MNLFVGIYILAHGLLHLCALAIVARNCHDSRPAQPPCTTALHVFHAQMPCMHLPPCSENLSLKQQLERQAALLVQLQQRWGRAVAAMPGMWGGGLAVVSLGCGEGGRWL